MQAMQMGKPGAPLWSVRDAGALSAMFGLAAMFTVHLITVCRRHPEILEPSAGQAGCCLCFAFVWQLWVLLRCLPSIHAGVASGGPGSPRVVTAPLGGSFPLLASLQASSLPYVDAAAEFGAIMALFWLCDRTPYFERSGKGYSRDFFWFLWGVLMCAGIASLRKCGAVRAPSVTKGPGSGGSSSLPLSQVVAEAYAKPLQRDQTEEWKGWMQVMFLLYHYFEAKELYNAIRIYIAAYVWMTGFGNFSYYYVKADFGLTRFCQMMWRLNFLCFFCCLVLQNDYMLYYICMLHTAFTVIIYACLGIKSEINHTSGGMALKFVATTTAVIVVWHVPGAFGIFWAPWRWLVLYKGSMHEWFFRSTLDHLVWIVGMATAFFFPNMDNALQRLETLPMKPRMAIKASIVMVCLFLLRRFYVHVFALDKYGYNAMHPYMSWLPITTYIILRNLSSTARQYYMGFFAWLGKITLETYIAQFHIWMSSTGPDFTWEPNASPKRLLRLLPAEYPLVNFLLVSGIYIGVSFRIFYCTVALRGLATPSDRDALLYNLKVAPVGLFVVYIISRLLLVL